MAYVAVSTEVLCVCTFESNEQVEHIACPQQGSRRGSAAIWLPRAHRNFCGMSSSVKELCRHQHMLVEITSRAAYSAKLDATAMAS